MQQTLTYPDDARRLAPGLVVSLLLHVLLLALWRMPSVSYAPPDARRWTEPLSVRLLPPKPLSAAPAQTDPPPPLSPARRPPHTAVAQPARPIPARPSLDQPATDRPAPARTDPQAITVIPAAPDQPAASPAKPATAQEAEPDVDVDKALAAARKMANNLEPPPMNWAAAKLNKGKEWKETRDQRLGRAISGAGRADCKTAYSGAGLLAPLFMLADKKDSGCKL
jgi:hypothetical protein